ncbi:M14 family metallopeptidase [Longibacter salinarum]|nr:M14 family metallopeptidase [Longibacter salinarum]
MHALHFRGRYPAAALAFLLVALVLSSPQSLRAQPQVPLSIDTPVPGVTEYDDAIPTPQDVIGHRIGERHTRPAQVVDYFQAVADASDRVSLESHGRTYEGRRLIHAIVTSPENQGRLDEIKSANQQLSSSPASVSDSDLESMPAVVMMGYSIHGDEASGTEASILLLYHLAAGNGSAVDGVLNDAVTIIDPMFNPDGRDRFVDWVNGNRGEVATTDPQDREHNQPWPGGRTNHYWFDLNRDWLPGQHPASQGRLNVFHDWRPQVLTDYHEMGPEATYFFQPGIPSRTNPNTPERNQRLTGEIATYHADYLKRIGSLFYTRESFDDFYYGKGSTYPDINGSIGILFEQASSRSLKTETSKGVMTYAFTVRNQFLASLSTMEAVTEMKKDLLAHQRDFYANRDDVLADAEERAYVIDLTDRRSRAQSLAETLQRHRVKLYDLGESVTQDGRTYRPGDAYVVPLDQEQGRFVKAVMERTSEYPDSLFYDVSTWTLPLAFGVDYAPLDRTPDLGSELDAVSLDGGEVVGGQSSYAYVMPWGRYYAPRAVYRLQDAGIRPRVMTDPFSVQVAGGGTRSFDRGAIVIQVQQRGVSPDSVHRAVADIAETDHVDIVAVAGGMTPSGPDLGSRGSEILPKPKVALITGTGGSSRYSGASAYDAGEVWHLLSERMHVPVSMIDVGSVENVDMDEYTTVVLAGGDYSGLPKEAMSTWVQDGGTLITLQDAAEWPIEAELVTMEKREVDVDSLVRGTSYADLQNAYGAQGIGGSIFEVELDSTHPVAYGYSDTEAVFRVGTGFYEPSKKPGVNVGTYATPARISGYISEEQAEAANGAASIEAHDVVRGNVVMFMDNPNFRAFWYGTNGLFLNAIFFSELL